MIAWVNHQLIDKKRALTAAFRQMFCGSRSAGLINAATHPMA